MRRTSSDQTSRGIRLVQAGSLGSVVRGASVGVERSIVGMGIVFPAVVIECWSSDFGTVENIGEY